MITSAPAAGPQVRFHTSASADDVATVTRSATTKRPGDSEHVANMRIPERAKHVSDGLHLEESSPVVENDHAEDNGSPGLRRTQSKKVTKAERDSVRELPDLMERIDAMGLTEQYMAYKDRYLGWRQGGARGAAGEVAGPSHVRSHGFGFWYPNLQTWQWRRTLSYWIAVTFFEGSIFFMISSFLWCIPERLGRYKAAVTTWGYIGGKINFFICTYLMCLETINLSNADVDNHEKGKEEKEEVDSEEGGFSSECNTSADGEDQWLWWPFHVRTALRKLEMLGAGPWPYYASAIYFVGVLTFTVGLAADFITSLPKEFAEQLLLWAFMLGSIMFMVGGASECVENKVFTGCDINQGYVGALFNLLGGMGFVIGAVLGFIPGMSFWSMLWYGVGSAVYALGAAVMLIMWKDEQFGLTFLAVLNDLGGPNGKPVVRRKTGEVKEQKTFSTRAACFLMIYIMTGVTSFYNMTLTVANIHEMGFLWVIEHAFSAFLPFIFAHFMLALNSGVYKTPEMAPFHQLYIGCRWLALLMLINNTARFYEALSDEGERAELVSELADRW